MGGIHCQLAKLTSIKFYHHYHLNVSARLKCSAKYWCQFKKAVKDVNNGSWAVDINSAVQMTLSCDSIPQTVSLSQTLGAQLA